MVGSFFTRIAVSSVLAFAIFASQVQAVKYSPAIDTSMFLRTTNRMPETCNCAKSKVEKTGTCYFKPKNSNKCKARACEASFECKPGMKTDTLCIRRKTTKKMVMKFPGHCIEIPISGFQYVPYNSGPSIGSGGSGSTRELPNMDTMPTSRRPSSPSPKPPSPPPQPVVKPTKNKRGYYLVVADKKVIYRGKYLNKAKNRLNKIKGGSRCIFQVRKGKVLFDPHRISGYPQTPKYGFKNFWWNWPDIRRMHAVAEKYYLNVTHKPKPKPKPKFIRTKNRRGMFLVVHKNAVVYKTTYLHAAKKYLRRSRGGSRCIFQVRRGKVRADPHLIAGYPQTPRYGFRKYWKNWNDIRRMHTIAQTYYTRITYKPKPSKSPKPSPSPSPRPIIIKTRNVPGEYYIISGNRLAFKASSLNKAKIYLRSIRRGSRCIFQVKDYRIVSNPRKIGGYPQSWKYGFKSYWKNSADIYRMYRVAVKHHHYPTRNVIGTYLVVGNNKCVLKTSKLKIAQHYLKKIHRGYRCIFEVKKGTVIRNPRMIAGYRQIAPFGFNKRWGSSKTIHHMYIIALKYYKKSIKPKTIRTKNFKGAYIIVAGKRVVGQVRWLDQAKRKLSLYKRGSRCIFKLRRGKVMENPRKIAGYPQTRLYGFNKSWKGSSDIRRMYWIGVKYLRAQKMKSRKKRSRPSKKKKSSKKKSNKKKKSGRRYVVVYGRRVIGNYPSLRRAVKKLKRVRRSSKTPRCIFRFVNGRLVKKPYMGGNKYWRRKSDVRRLYSYAGKYMKKRGY